MSDDRQTTETGQISETDIFQMTGRRVRRLKQGQISDETKICRWQADDWNKGRCLRQRYVRWQADDWRKGKGRYQRQTCFNWQLKQGQISRIEAWQMAGISWNKGKFLRRRHARQLTDTRADCWNTDTLGFFPCYLKMKAFSHRKLGSKRN
jgi:hypothetical protein